MGMAIPHKGRSENCPLVNKRKRILGSRLNRNWLKQNFNKELKPVFSLIVVSRVTSLRRVLSQNLPDYLWEQWNPKSPFPPL
jgi:hypothetical protein